MFLRDFLLAWRKLVRRPGAALLAVVSLALAIGFSTAAFSVVDAWYWRALPVKDPGRLADAMVRDREGRFDGINWAEFEAIQQQARTLDGIMVQNRQGPVVKLRYLRPHGCSGPGGADRHRSPAPGLLGNDARGRRRPVRAAPDHVWLIADGLTGGSQGYAVRAPDPLEARRDP